MSLQHHLCWIATLCITIVVVAYEFHLVAVMLIVMSGLGFVLLNKKLINKKAARYVSRLYFVPCLPCTILGQYVKYGQWWTDIDAIEPSGPPVLLGAAPFDFLGKVDELHELGISASINMCDEWCGPLNKYASLGWEQLWLRCVDHEEPTLQQLHQAVDFIHTHRAQGNGVYIHCKAGHGRAAAVAFAWLVVSRRQTLQQTQDALLAMRPVRKTLWKQPNLVQFYHECLEMQPMEPCQASEEETAIRVSCEHEPSLMDLEHEDTPMLK